MSNRKRSVKISGHATSVTLEDEFWAELIRLSKERAISINALISEIDETRKTLNLSSALRVYILNDLKRSSPKDDH